MKLSNAFSLAAGLGYFLWVVYILIGGMVAAAGIIFFPYGALPVMLFTGVLIYYKSDDIFQRFAGSKLRRGITEYPLEASMHLYGENENKISFARDGKSIVLTSQRSSYIDFGTPEGVKEYLKEKSRGLEGANLDWIDSYIVSSASVNEKTGELAVIISIPDEIVLSEKYIEHEIRSIGRVFVRNLAGNSIRWLQQAQGERKLERINGRLFVYVDRKQVVPGFLRSKIIIMSKNQITRNIRTRLWNRVNVKFISLDENIYCGELIDV
ncbi:hypothetical protein [Pseudomonas sp. EA_105y_Pfl2_R69]|uniref:hypothetical protein n=1 Tax=Pseudomonas sp. EA_105y_Pfl2_R69 TaxID=3088683 RepID=UPI0030D863A0